MQLLPNAPAPPAAGGGASSEPKPDAASKRAKLIASMGEVGCLAAWLAAEQLQGAPRTCPLRRCRGCHSDGRLPQLPAMRWAIAASSAAHLAAAPHAQVVRNPLIWLLAVAYFFVYVVRQVR
jgi:sugar phosphate permease